MDETNPEKPDYYLLIDSYLKGWLDDGAMAEVDYRLETDEEFRKQAATLLALRQEAADIQYNERSRTAVRDMLKTIAVQRRPAPTRLGQLWKTVSTNFWAVASIVILLIGLTFVLYRLYLGPQKPPITQKPRSVEKPDSTKQPHETNDQVAQKGDSLRKRPSQTSNQPVLVDTKPIQLSPVEKSDDLYGSGPDEKPVSVLITQRYRITGRARYEIRQDSLKLYLPEQMLTSKSKLVISQPSDSTFTLKINKKTFLLQRKGRHFL